MEGKELENGLKKEGKLVKKVWPWNALFSWLSSKIFSAFQFFEFP